MEPLPINSDYLLMLSGLSAGGVALNAATVSYALKNAAGTTIGSGSLAYLAATDGDYSATVPASTTALLVEGQLYTFFVTITQGGYTDHRSLNVRAYLRGAK